MKKSLRIINIDGISGIGKTTQVRILNTAFKADDMPVKVLQLENNIESALETLKQVNEFLEANKDGIVICDGSIARMIVEDSLSGVDNKHLAEKYLQVIFEYEKLNHLYGITNMLLIADDVKFCHDRILKRGRLENKEEKGISDFKYEKEVVKGMRFFNSNTISKDIDFHVVDVDDDDSILDIKEKIWQFLNDNYTIKKPSSEGF